MMTFVQIHVLQIVIQEKSPQKHIQSLAISISPLESHYSLTKILNYWMNLTFIYISLFTICFLRVFASVSEYISRCFLDLYDDFSDILRIHWRVEFAVFQVFFLLFTSTFNNIYEYTIPVCVYVCTCIHLQMCGFMFL